MRWEKGKRKKGGRRELRKGQSHGEKRKEGIRCGTNCEKENGERSANSYKLS